MEFGMQLKLFFVFSQNIRYTCPKYLSIPTAYLKQFQWFYTYKLLICCCLCHTENVFVSLWQKFWHLLFLRSPFVLAFEGFEGSHSSCQWIVALSGSSSCFSSSCNNACTTRYIVLYGLPAIQSICVQLYWYKY